MNKYEGDMPEATVEIGTDVGGKSKWTGDEVAAKQSALERAGDRVNGAITGFFYSTGLSIGRNPRKWAFATFFVAVIFGAGIGFPGITNESRGDKLWVPADTEAQDDLKYVDQYYGPEARFGEVILKPADGGDALRPTILDALATLVAGVEATTVEWEGATSLGGSVLQDRHRVRHQPHQPSIRRRHRSRHRRGDFRQGQRRPDERRHRSAHQPRRRLGRRRARRERGRRRREGTPRRFLDQDPSDDRERRRAGSSRRRVRARTLGSVQRGRRRGGSVLHRAAFLR